MSAGTMFAIIGSKVVSFFFNLILLNVLNGMLHLHLNECFERSASPLAIIIAHRHTRIMAEAASASGMA